MKLYFKTDSQCLKCKIQQPNLHNHQTRGSHMEISFPLLVGHSLHKTQGARTTQDHHKTKKAHF